jgi:hypothetical protein
MKHKHEPGAKCIHEKFTPLTLAHAMKLILGGRQLREVSRITGMHPSYVSKLASGSLDIPRWRQIDPELMFRTLERQEMKLVAKLERVREKMADCKVRGA